MVEKSPLSKLKELLPNLEGKVHLADQDLIKEVVVKEVIQKGAKFIQDNNRIVADYRHIRVIFKKINKLFFVITIMIRK